MKLLDRYILKQFVLSTFVSIVGFVIIYVAIDMMEKLDKFLDKKVPATIVAEYYINFVPQILSLILPVGLMLGALFATGKMSTQNEIIAMRSAGMSLYRFMLPFVAAGLIISGGAVYFNGWILPRANARVLEIQREHVQENLVSNTAFNLHMQESPTTVVVMRDFIVNQERANQVSIQFFSQTERTHMIRRIDAEKMEWDTSRKRWHLVAATERSFAKDSVTEQYRSLPESEAYLQLSFTPLELRERQLRQDELTNPELRRRIALKERSGQDVARDLVDYNAKYSMAFTSLVVILFAVPFASRKKRGGLSIEFVVAIFISFIFLAFTKVSHTFGYSGAVEPAITAWMANAIFLTIAGFVILKAQK